jgi:protein KRI1
LQKLDLEGEWDPEAHDNQMAQLYGGDNDGDDEKPQWDDDIDIGDIVITNSGTGGKVKKKKKKGEERDGAGEGVDVADMDADVERVDEQWDGTEEMRKRKLDEYMDEIYGLDFNDVVGFSHPFSFSVSQKCPFLLTLLGWRPSHAFQIR